MIFEAIFNVIFYPLYGLLSLLPDISWEVHPDVFESFFAFIRLAGYLLPMGTVLSILKYVVLFNVFKILISIIKTVWNLIPFT